MGLCATKGYRNQKSSRLRKLHISCEICSECFNSTLKKPYTVCSNGHLICEICLNRIKDKHKSRNQPTICPFCKVVCEEDKVVVEPELDDFLRRESTTWDRIPDDQKKLFAFSTMYAHHLNTLMRQIVDPKSDNPRKVENVKKIRINGRINDLQVLELDIFECLPLLRDIELTGNKLHTIDTANYYHQSVEVLNLGHNHIASMQKLLGQGDAFRNLKTLLLSNNLIDQIGGISCTPRLTQLDLSYNKLSSMKELEACPHLVHLNLEFNRIQQLSRLTSFPTIWSLRLYGNKIVSQNWQQDLPIKDMGKLRLLTLSVWDYDHEKRLKTQEQIRRQIRADSPLLKMVIFEAWGIKDERDLEMNGNSSQLKIIELYSSTYELHMTQKQAHLQSIMKEARQYSPFGAFVEFHTAMFNKESYQHQEGQKKYTKLTDSEDPCDYLYSKAYSPSQQRNMSLVFSSKGVVVGVCQFMAGPEDTLEFDLEYSKLRNSGQHDEDFIAGIPEEEGEVKIQMTWGGRDKAVTLWLNEKPMHKALLPAGWQELRVFLHLRRPETWVRSESVGAFSK